MLQYGCGGGVSETIELSPAAAAGTRAGGGGAERAGEQQRHGGADGCDVADEADNGRGGMQADLAGGRLVLGSALMATRTHDKRHSDQHLSAGTESD